MPDTPYSASPTPGSSSGQKHMVGDALYSWCQERHDYGHVFTQNELLNSDIIPNRSLQILLQATQYLGEKHLFKLHDIRGQDEIAWELVKPEIAQSYHGLTQDEQMVFAAIEASGTQGLWTKTIKAKLSAHAKVLDRVYKSLEAKQLIKQMKSVKNPGRKMYIEFRLQPSEEATGGAWFTEGRLDIEMIDAISGFVEQFCSKKSWREVIDSDDEQEMETSLKRKQPEDGFEETQKGKGKAIKQEPDTKPTKRKISLYEPHEPGYNNYPTRSDISKEILRSQLIESGQPLPENALAQLLDVMVYDDNLFKMYRDPRGGEAPDDPETGQITMYRSFKNPYDLRQETLLRQKLENGSKTASRMQELEDIGRGGSSEVPCLGCPNFDICGDGGPINVQSCVYFPDWFKQMEEADREADDPWPTSHKSIKPAITKSRRLVPTIPQSSSQTSRPDPTGRINFPGLNAPILSCISEGPNVKILSLQYSTA